MIRFLITLLLFSLTGIVLFPVVYQLLPETLFNGIVFYTGILAALIVFSISFDLGLVFLFKKRAGNFSEITTPLALLTSSFTALSFNLAFLIVFPVTLDRSVSTYLLENIRKEQKLSPEKLQEILINDYIINRQAVPRRIQEQITTGNIRLDKDNNIELTEQGENFLKFGEWIKKIFKLKDRAN